MIHRFRDVRSIFSLFVSVAPAKYRVVSYVRPGPLSSISLPVYYSLIILLFDILWCELLAASLNKQYVTNKWLRKIDIYKEM
jgi:hypothetical protein